MITIPEKPEDPEEEDEDIPNNGKGKGKGAAATKKRKRGAKTAEDDEEEEAKNEPEEDEKPAKRTTRSRRGAAKATKQDDGEEPAEEIALKGNVKGKGAVKSEDSAPSSSSSAPVDPLTAKLRDQNKAVWQMRDKIKGDSGRGLKQYVAELLQANGYEVSPHWDVEKVVGYLADAMVFGRTQVSRLVAKEYEYACPGQTEWAKCTFSTTDPMFEAFDIPEDNAEEEWLEGYKWTPQERVFIKKREAPAQPAKNMREELKRKRLENATRIIDTDQPFKGRTFAFAGKLSATQAHYQTVVQNGGGEIAKTIGDGVTMVISTKAEVDKASSKIKQAEEWEIDVVDESYINDCIEQKKRFYHGDPKYILIANRKETDESGSKKRKTEEEERPKTTKLTVKGGAAVDPASDLEQTHHVLKEGNLLWSIVLAKADVQTGRNSYYKLQVLEPDRTGSYYLFRSWGRVGTDVGGDKVENLPKQVAKEQFRALYLEKCGNEFGDPNPKKIPGLLFPLEVDFGEEDDKLGAGSIVEAGSKTQLAQPIQDLMRLIFDVKAMRETLKEMEIDLTKMPLGKISKNMITSAYEVLSKAMDLVTNGSEGTSHGQIIALSNQFFTLVPHDFGTGNAPLLNDKDIIHSKVEMLDTLRDMEIATTLLKTGDDQKEEDPIDVHYTSLKTKMEVVNKDSEEFRMIEECTKSTHAPTHTNYTLEIEDVFRVERYGERDRFVGNGWDRIDNQKVLWHGSRITNFAGILSQGLRIAPPEAPVTGCMFGKGIYFADMVSKSANYCFASADNPRGLLILSEVALGQMYERVNAEYVEKLPRGKSSTKGVGQTGPSKFVPFPYRTFDEKDPVSESGEADGKGLHMPMGPPGPQPLPGKARHSSLLYNEYIVYDVNQVVVRYLIKVKFNFGRRR
ncbi:Poly [ADP-ribose] polymerase 1 [Rhizophlyctis rosea]|uniref:Poly [ADP-ribose] polymerase n=1 Tax=Rhizophlyctis rosea TaxID=64517 RepID=A0AAD5SHE1_9FUNG|nr:Poly [ADP-ribose] polymerase 1 [Rhizophlyctis rosea]